MLTKILIESQVVLCYTILIINIKSSFNLLYHIEVCNDFSGLISMSLCRLATHLISKKYCSVAAIANTVSDLTTSRFESQTRSTNWPILCN